MVSISLFTVRIILSLPVLFLSQMWINGWEGEIKATKLIGLIGFGKDKEKLLKTKGEKEQVGKVWGGGQEWQGLPQDKFGERFGGTFWKRKRKTRRRHARKRRTLGYRQPRVVCYEWVLERLTHVLSEPPTTKHYSSSYFLWNTFLSMFSLWHSWSAPIFKWSFLEFPESLLDF